MFQLVYMSKTDQTLGFKEISSILNIARRNNARDNITGILVHHDDIFFQVLEGERAAVYACYSRIELDNNHRKVTCLWSGVVGKRTFPNWAMGYADPAELAPQAKDSLVSLANLKSTGGTTLADNSVASKLVHWILRDFTDVQ